MGHSHLSQAMTTAFTSTFTREGFRITKGIVEFRYLRIIKLIKSANIHSIEALKDEDTPQWTIRIYSKPKYILPTNVWVSSSETFVFKDRGDEIAHALIRASVDTTFTFQ